MQVPTTIDGAQLLKVARLHGTRPTGFTRHCRDGELQTPAHAQHDGEVGVCLFYCDDAWTV